MAEKGYLLSANALRDLKRLKETVQTLNSRVNRLGVSGPRTGNQVFAKISDSDSTSYSGNQVYYDGTVWTVADGGITWTKGVAPELRELDGYMDVANGEVYPVDIMSDGTTAWWGFKDFASTRRIDFMHYLDATTGALRFYDGTVWVEDDEGAVVTDGGTGFDATADNMFWVETSTPWGGETTVNATIQSGTMDKYLQSETANPLVTKTGLLQISGGVRLPMLEGDVYFQTLYTPVINADVRADGTNSMEQLGRVDHTNSAEDADGYFLTMRTQDMTYLAGELWSVSDGIQLRFGGRTRDDDFEFTSDISAVEDDVTFTRKQKDYEFENGLVKDWVENDANGFHLKARGKWFGLEPGANQALGYHKESPGEDEFWEEFGWDGTNWTVDGTSVTDATVRTDNRGHIFLINGDSQPSDATNYRYVHCSDPDTYEALIFATDQSTGTGNTIEVESQCYIFDTTTILAATSPTPTVGSSYANCAACEAAGDSRQWKSCIDDSNIEVFSAGVGPEVDYAWLCHDSTWTPAYNHASTFDVATDPSWMYQCDNAVPLDCSDLDGWPASDDFGGANCNSGSVGDTNWGIRWTATQNDGTRAINAGQLRYTVACTGASLLQEDQNNVELTGDFTTDVKVSMTQHNDDNTVSQGGQIRIYTTTGTVVYLIYINKKNASTNANWEIVVYNGTTSNQIVNNYSSDTVWLRVTRTSNTLKAYYSTNGTSWTYTGASSDGSNSSTLNPGFMANTVQSAALDLIVDFDDVSITPETRIDPTGQACT
jgi:hypothetical protein